jgi:glycosyltransferase involved in cell wall biosynthesis
MLSILMPVYNEIERAEEAIREVLATELPTDFELIIVDDGSSCAAATGDRACA